MRNAGLLACTEDPAFSQLGLPQNVDISQPLFGWTPCAWTAHITRREWLVVLHYWTIEHALGP